MGEVVTSGDKSVRVVREESESGNSMGLMRWEKFLPKMILRVLLVEADDSTRQIIAALLRKCSYKVAAVSDGLKAWELLKGRPHGVDLILTEVDLPSISGYALLTLIMEHDICKNIPVIMMSSQDSISTVYKCMLRGAADYLVKPIRKNELRNLWQHVWRRQSSTTGINGPQDESVAQQKVEATAENNAASNRSSGDAACIQRNKELIEKGSDAQSSCTKPDLEAESGPVDDMQEFSPLKGGDEAYPSGTETQEVETCIRLGQTLMMHDSRDGGLTVGVSKNGEASTTKDKDADPEHFGNASISDEARDNHYVQINSSKEAIDLIGTFRTHPNCTLKNSTVNCTGKFDFSPQLDLSLRRSRPSSFENELTEDRHTLMHSNASAFKRYTNRHLQASTPAVLINFCDQQREQRTNCEKNISHVATGCNSDSSTPSMQKCIMSPTTVQSKESELATSHSSEQLYEPCGPNGNNTQNHIVYTQEHKSEHAEDRGHISPTTDQSVSSSFCNGNASHLNSIGYGSNCGSSSNVEQVTTVMAASEAKNEDLTNNGNSHRSIQREAALNKFRLKRKERCYEKKVRYESRKKLAEQRPRVKGQFVRQVNPDPLVAEKDGKEYDHLQISDSLERRT
uniref:Two-component response regulator-like PRR95 n=1 Tax=Cajanus cajan TaxID=3821 RepID=A0A151R7T8_CAJCA|nr:Two-component response regulator-like PRR95 [Cajanus cajan]